MLQTDGFQQKVFVVGDGSLFDEGVTHILRDQNDLLVSHAVYSNDLSFFETVRSEEPDTILVNDSGSLDVERILDFAVSRLTTMKLRIIVIRLVDNVINIHEMKASKAGKGSLHSWQTVASSRDDLIDNVINASP